MNALKPAESIPENGGSPDQKEGRSVCFTNGSTTAFLIDSRWISSPVLSKIGVHFQFLPEDRWINR